MRKRATKETAGASWADRQTTPVAVADWKEPVEGIICQVNHQLRFATPTGATRLRLRCYYGGGGWTLSLVVDGQVLDKAYIDEAWNCTGKDVLEHLDALIRRWGLRVKYSPEDTGDQYVWVLVARRPAKW